MGFRRAHFSLGRLIALAIPGALVAASVAAWDGLADHTKPRRIIAMAPNSAEVVCALGACERIVGVSKFCVFPAELKERPLIGGLYDPDLEKIISLRPDLLITRGRNESLERVCEQMKVPIYHDETDTLAGIEKCVRELGKMLDRDDAAEKLVGDFRSRLDAIRARTRNKTKPRVMLTVSRQPDRLANILTTGRGTFLDEMIDIAGGVNVFGDIDMIYPEVSAEAIIAKQPQVIIELIPEVKLTDELESRMREQWRRLGSIPAVTDDRVYFLTDDNGLIPSPRYVEFVEKVSRLLHSEGDR
jgi:iron complex transport system substrate-binding protein